MAEYDIILGTNHDLIKVIGDLIKYFTTLAIQTLEPVILIQRQDK
jgi:hypothetical protein